VISPVTGGDTSLMLALRDVSTFGRTTDIEKKHDGADSRYRLHCGSVSEAMRRSYQQRFIYVIEEIRYEL